jgi:hypothetical protein
MRDGRLDKLGEKDQIDRRSSKCWGERDREAIFLDEVDKDGEKDWKVDR